MYGDAYVEQLLKKANELDVPLGDVLATATRFTAECISAGVRDYCPVKPDRMIVGGGGSMNPTLLARLRGDDQRAAWFGQQREGGRGLCRAGERSHVRPAQQRPRSNRCCTPRCDG